MTGRVEGIVKSWNDERGFGFITPVHGGDDIFAHIKAFPARSPAPQMNQRVSFAVELGPNGKKRASHIALVQVATATGVKPNRLRRSAATPRRGVSLFAVPAFLLLYLALTIVWKIPHAVGIGFLVLSTICFMAYAIDKSAAQSGAWRIRESSLLLLGLFGGWPGAVLAQQWLRHKSTKPSFRRAFWATAVVNVLALVTLSALRVG